MSMVPRLRISALKEQNIAGSNRMSLLLLGYKTDCGFHARYSPSFSLGLLILGEDCYHVVRQLYGVACVSELDVDLLRPAKCYMNDFGGRSFPC